MLARARLRDGGRNTYLDTTALVHEAYLRMAGRVADIQERRQLLAYASRTMRSVIVDFARQRQAARRGGNVCFLTFTGSGDVPAEAGADDIVRVHEALAELERLDGRLGQVVEMRYFAGLDDEQIALALGVSARTVRRDWEKARLVLQGALRG